MQVVYCFIMECYCYCSKANAGGMLSYIATTSLAAVLSDELPLLCNDGYLFSDDFVLHCPNVSTSLAVM